MPPRRTRKPPTPSPPPAPVIDKEREYHTAFSLFATPLDSVSSPPSDVDPDDEEDTDLVTVRDARKALRALKLPPPPSDFFEPDQRWVAWRDFRELAQTLDELGGDEDDEADDVDPMDIDEEEEDEDEEPEKPTSRKPPAKSAAKGKDKQTSKPLTKKAQKEQEKQQEVDHAFKLFTHQHLSPSADTSAKRITIADLKRVARELREEIDDSMLKRMILLANGDDGPAGWQKGVSRDDFEAVMKRAGLLGRSS